MTVSALRWTRDGAVATPEVLQIRLEPQFEGRVAAGAPNPTRATTDDEVVENAAWFADPGPRGRAVHSVVLSGWTPRRWAGAPALIARVRAAGMTRVILHLPADLSGSEPSTADVVSVAVRNLAAARAVGTAHRVVIPLEAEVLAGLSAIVSALPEGPGITLLWPFPGPGVPPPPAVREVVAGVRKAGSHLVGRDWGIKGLAVCALLPLRNRFPDIAQRVWRSANRWYVDADHQRSAALTFQPDLVRFAKIEACRFCAVEPRCDGVPEAWLGLGLAGPMLPIQDGP